MGGWGGRGEISDTPFVSHAAWLLPRKPNGRASRVTGSTRIIVNSARTSGSCKPPIFRDRRDERSYVRRRSSIADVFKYNDRFDVRRRVCVTRARATDVVTRPIIVTCSDEQIDERYKTAGDASVVNLLIFAASSGDTRDNIAPEMAG